MYLYLYMPDLESKPVLATPVTFNKPLSEEAAKKRMLRFYRRGFLEIQTPRENEVASNEEIKKNGWEEV